MAVAKCQERKKGCVCNQRESEECPQGRIRSGVEDKVPGIGPAMHPVWGARRQLEFPGSTAEGG